MFGGQGTKRSFFVSSFLLFMPVNIEIKARCPNPEHVRAVLEAAGARRVGLDRQIDTYFEVERGRLKLRSGDIEKSLIYYERPDGDAPKKSEVLLHRCADPETLERVLRAVFKVKCVVDKRREIYYHGNVKLHVDDVESLGSFVEIEVIHDADETSNRAIDEDQMLAECNAWMARLGVNKDDLMRESYSDMIAARD